MDRETKARWSYNCCNECESTFQCNDITKQYLREAVDTVLALMFESNTSVRAVASIIMISHVISKFQLYCLYYSLTLKSTHTLNITIVSSNMCTQTQVLLVAHDFRGGQSDSDFWNTSFQESQGKSEGYAAPCNFP